MDSSDQFSKRERDVIELLLQGKSNKQIAFLLHTTPRTIEYHLTNIYSKLGIGSRSEAIILLTKFYSTTQVIPEDNGLRESTIVPPVDIRHNKNARIFTGRQPMGSKKYIFVGIGLVAFLTIGYLIFTNLFTYDQQTPINTGNPETSLILSPSPIYTQQESLTDEDLGLHVLVDYLNYLYQGDYEKAAQLYGGTYETMVNQNPDIDPADHIALLKNACTINGMQCLKIYSAGPSSAGPFGTNEISNRTEFKYQVEFAKNDGSLFGLGPCCGGNATDSPPQSIFNFTVTKVSNDEFLVMDLPPYSP